MDTVSPAVTGKNTTKAAIEPEWLSPSQFGKKFNVSRVTTYKLIAEGKIDARKFGPFKTVISVSSGRAYFNSLPKVQASLPKPRRRKAVQS
jgi:hypothetical protein